MKTIVKKTKPVKNKNVGRAKYVGTNNREIIYTVLKANYGMQEIGKAETKSFFANPNLKTVLNVLLPVAGGTYDALEQQIKWALTYQKCPRKIGERTSWIENKAEAKKVGFIPRF